MKKIRNWCATAFATCMMSFGLMATATVTMLMPTEAKAEVCVSGGVCVLGNRFRSDFELLQQFDDMKMTVKNSLEYLGYGDIMYVQNDPTVITHDNDGRCPGSTKATLAGANSTSDFGTQTAKAQALINQFKGPVAAGGLGAALPARSGIPAQPSGWASVVAGMPKDSNGFYLMTVIWSDGSSSGFRLVVPGGSGGDKNNATLTTSNPVAWIKSPAMTAPGQADKAACPF